MTILLLIQIYTRSCGEVAVTDDIATEVARTLVGLIGVVLAVPVTTVIAVLLPPPVRLTKHRKKPCRRPLKPARVCQPTCNPAGQVFGVEVAAGACPALPSASDRP